jgi:hypothetical protein
MIKHHRIPNTFINDHAARLLVEQWIVLRHEYALKEKRVSRMYADAGPQERQRTKDRRALIQRMRALERTILTFAAEATHHPDLWVDPTAIDSARDPLNDRVAYSKRSWLIRYWFRMNKRASPQMRNRNAINLDRTRQRHNTMRELIELEYGWIVSIASAMFPGITIPDEPISRHPRYWRP